MRLRLGRTDKAQQLASRPAGVLGMGGWCRDRVRYVGEIAVVTGRVVEESVGHRM